MFHKRLSNAGSPKNRTETYGIALHITFFVSYLILLCVREVNSIHSFVEASSYSLTHAEYLFAVLFCGANMPYSSLAILLLLESPIEQCAAAESRSQVNPMRLNGLTNAFMVAIAMLSSITVISLLISFPVASNGLIWSETAIVAQYPTAISVIPQFILSHFLPLTAILLASIVLFLFWFISALFLQFMSLLKLRILGTIIYIIGIGWGCIWFRDIARFVPIRNYTLSAMIRYAAPGAETLAVTQGILYLVFIILIFVPTFSIIEKLHKSKETSIMQKKIKEEL